MSENNTPSISKIAFNCPHCGVYAAQNWHRLIANPYSKKDRTPYILISNIIKKFEEAEPIDKEANKENKLYYRKITSKKPFFGLTSARFIQNLPIVENCNLSQCHNCEGISLWIHDKIVYPNVKVDISPNNDLPEHIRQLFEEAREIVNLSPRGAAALLRLCVQHLCRELGESGKNIDKDIANLVSKGLDPLVQKSLDIVRVIGNESVHPGKIDLKDNSKIAIKLFNLINFICDQMITKPKEIEGIYEDLPKEKLEGIENRNTKAVKE